MEQGNQVLAFLTKGRMRARHVMYCLHYQSPLGLKGWIFMVRLLSASIMTVMRPKLILSYRTWSVMWPGFGGFTGRIWKSLLMGKTFQNKTPTQFHSWMPCLLSAQDFGPEPQHLHNDQMTQNCEVRKRGSFSKMPTPFSSCLRRTPLIVTESPGFGRR